MIRDPRSEAEKARADLARNAEMGLAVPESPLEEGPSVTPETFGEHHANWPAKEARDLDDRPQGGASRGGCRGFHRHGIAIRRAGAFPSIPTTSETKRPDDDEDVLLARKGVKHHGPVRR